MRLHSPRAIAPAEEPPSAAPLRHASTTASHAGVPRRSSTTSPGSPPHRYTPPASRAAATIAGSRPSLRPRSAQLLDVGAERREPAPCGRDRAVRVLANGGRRNDVDRAAGGGSQEGSILRLVPGHELRPAGENQRSVAVSRHLRSVAPLAEP